MFLRHAVGFVVNARLGLEIRRHQFDHAGDEILFAHLGLDRAAGDQPLDQMGREGVDLRVSRDGKERLVEEPETEIYTETSRGFRLPFG